MNIRDEKQRAAKTVKNSAQRAAHTAVNVARNIQSKHEKIADHADTMAKGARVAAGVAVVGAVVAAPSGLTAVGVWLGVVSAPFIVTAAPVLVGAAGIAFTVSAGASLLSKAQKRKARVASTAAAPRTTSTPDSSDT